jgi:transketolase
VEILGSIFWLRYRENFPITKFVLSKGHAAMALYSTALQFNLLDSNVLEKYLGDETLLWGHPSVSKNFEFIHWSTGSLGHGLPACVGFAYAEKYLKKTSPEPGTVVAVVSDGELNEGSCWEALLFASHHKLDNLVIIVDYNKIQSFGRVDEVMALEPLVPKFEAFGLNCKRLDGHSPELIMTAIKESRAATGRPTCIVADTIKGKGVPDLEDTLESHYKPISNAQLETFINEK